MDFDSRKSKAVLGSVMTALFLAAMDQTVVATALPRISAELHGMALYAWVITAYMLAVTIVIPIAGSLGDLYGRRPLMLLGVGIFFTGSLLGGFAPSMEALVGFRAFQGLGAGIVTANATPVLGDIFPPAELGRYNGYLSSVFGLASICGPILGGILTDTVGWRWIFWINVPFCLITGVILYAFLPRSARRAAAEQPDYAGVLFLVVALIPTLLALSWIGKGAHAPHPALLACGAVALLGWVAFFMVERRVKAPVLPLQLFRNGIFTTSTAALFLASIVLYTVAIYTPLFMQGVFGLDATRAGLVMTPMVVALVVASVIGGVLITKRGRYKVITVIGLMIALPPLYLLSQLRAGNPVYEAYLYTGLLGFGLGLTLPTLVLVTQNAVPYRFLGVATSLGKFFRSLGGIVGIAAAGVMLNHYMGGELYTHLPPGLNKGFTGTQEPLLAPLRDALGGTLGLILLCCLAVMASAVVVSLFIREIPLRKTVEDEPETCGESDG